jgi:N-acetylneuraminic acid mutarotase
MEINMSKSVVLVLVFVFLAACMFATMPVSASAEETENTWVSKAPMNQARAYLGVAVVNGKIYAIGGSEKNREMGTNEEYDPATDTWTLKAPMPTPSSYFATAVYQGKIYCLGKDLNKVYDPATDEWENKTSAPFYIAQANVVNGKIYVIGGYPNNTLNEVYDPANDTWTTKTPMPTAAAAASAVFNNRIYFMGGYFNDNGGAISLTQIYDPNTDTWSLGAPSPTFFVVGSAAVTTGTMAPKCIYVFDNPYGDRAATPDDPFYTNQVYDPETDSWMSGAEILPHRFDFGIAAVDDLIYVIGGYTVTYPLATKPVSDWSSSDWIKWNADGGAVFTYCASVEVYTPFGYGTVPPAVSVVSLENNKTYAGAEVALNFTVNKPVAWMGYSLDGQDSLTITGNTTVTGLAGGLHNITVYAKDSFENIGNSETIFFSVAEPFPTAPVAVGAVALTVVGVGLLVYFKKRKY